MFQDQSVFQRTLDDEVFGVRRRHSIGAVGVIAIVAFTITTIEYFWYRLPLWNPDAPILAGALLAAELFGVLTLVLHVFQTWTLIERRAPPVPAGFEADVLITTLNESADILRRTLLAAKQVTHVRAIWLLDDGCRPAMEELASELGVCYVARQDRSDAKAGNLNNALQITDAPFVAILDCDHAPSPDFLEQTLGYFCDPRVAFVQTPQDFYNVDSFQHRRSSKSQEAWHEQTLFYRVIQAGKDRWNATFFCGSCAVMRRAALDDIGGFATGTITEDMHTSLRLHKNGWSAVYHQEALAFGLSPVNLEQYMTQRIRWGRGAMQVWNKEGLLLGNNMSLAQRLAYFSSCITYFEGWQKAVVYFLPMYVLVTGTMPIIWTGWPFILIFSLWLLSGIVVNEVFSRGYAKTVWMEEYNFLRFYSFMKATFALLIPIKWKFSVTPKSMNDDTQVVIRLWPQLVVALGAIGSIVFGSYRYAHHHHLPEGAYLANLFWLTINTALAIKALAFVNGRRKQRRSGHRFPLPVVTRIWVKKEGKLTEVSAIAADISSDGMNLMVHDNLPHQGNIKGNFLLPSGPAEFRGEIVGVRGGTSAQGKSLGVKFHWVGGSHADALNSCLYGNALQWDVNSWAEVRKFNFTRQIAKWFLPNVCPALPWAIGRAYGRHASVDCLVIRDAKVIRILSYSELPADSTLRVRTTNGEVFEELTQRMQRTYSIGRGSVYLAILSQDAQKLTGFHREPAWTSPRRAA